jgi:hypothetical protein
VLERSEDIGKERDKKRNYNCAEISNFKREDDNF